jgi:DNA-binding transcriptional ArsR family regulator
MGRLGPLHGCEVLQPMNPPRPAPPSPPSSAARQADDTPAPRKLRPPKGVVARRFGMLNRFVDLALPKLGEVDTAVWICLFRHAPGDGTVTMSAGDLGRRCGYGEQAVRRALTRLRAGGLIDRLKRGSLTGGPSVYRLLSPRRTES